MTKVAVTKPKKARFGAQLARWLSLCLWSVLCTSNLDDCEGWAETRSVDEHRGRPCSSFL